MRASMEFWNNVAFKVGVTTHGVANLGLLLLWLLNTPLIPGMSHKGETHNLHGARNATMDK